MGRNEPIKRLSEELEQQAVEMALDGKKYVDICKILGFTNKYAFRRYILKFEEFRIQLDDARNAYCDDLEDQLLEIPLTYNEAEAKQLSTNIMRVLEYRNPKRYSTKYQHEVQVSVDISGSLDRAERRVLESSINNVIEIQAARSKESNDDE